STRARSISGVAFHIERIRTFSSPTTGEGAITMTQATQPTPSSAARTPYHVTLNQIECCNCNHGCNCQFGGFPDHGNCEFVLGFEITGGQFGAVPLAGVRMAAVCLYPKAIHEGNGRVVLFVDERARPEQVEAVAKIMSGQHGGMPWEALAATITSFTGPVVRPIEMKVDGTRSSFRVPGAVEVVQTPIRDSVSGQEKEVHIVYPKGGFMWNDGSICTTSTMSVDYDGIRFHHEGRYACFAPTKWANQ
ncbi:MAG TPA: DUF1326 domain-containing protein, partial [Gemmatimonadales bacterium]|nr:DUF1326 domain-containing protein [Gemmatimonadales bacterium]